MIYKVSVMIKTAIVKFHFVHKLGASEPFFILEKTESEHAMSYYNHEFNQFIFYQTNVNDL